jgi:hypothetical protein
VPWEGRCFPQRDFPFSLLEGHSVTSKTLQWAFLVFLVFCLVGGPGADAHAADIQSTWNGGTGSWDEPSNWTHVGSGSPDFPDNDELTYDAIIGAGVAQTDTQFVTIDSLDLSGGTISETGTGSGIYLTTGLDFSAGTLDGVYVEVSDGAYGIWSGGTIQRQYGLHNYEVLDLDGSDFYIDGGGGLAGLVNHDTINWSQASGTSQIHLSNFGAIWNNPGATFTISGAGDTRLVDAGGMGWDLEGFDNQGRFVKTGTGTTEFEVLFRNTRSSSEFDLQEGVVVFSGGGSVIQPSGEFWDGTLSIAPGSSFVIDGAHFGLGSMTSIDNAGTFEVRSGRAIFTRAPDIPTNYSDGGRVVVSGGELRLVETSMQLDELELSAGSIYNPKEITLAPSGSFSWTGGELDGADGALIIPSGGTLSMGGTGMFLRALELRNQGTASWTTAGDSDLWVGVYGTLSNWGDFTIDTASGDTASVLEHGAPALMENYGSMLKSGLGQLRIETPFVQHAGAFLEIAQGEMRLEGDATLDGVTTLTGGDLWMTNHHQAAQTLAAGGVINGVGSLYLGNTSSGSSVIEGTIGDDLYLELVGRTEFNSDLTRSQLYLGPSSELVGTADVRITDPGVGTPLWCEGCMVGGSGAFISDGYAFITGDLDSSSHFARRTFEMNGPLDIRGHLHLSSEAALISRDEFLLFHGSGNTITGEAGTRLENHGLMQVTSGIDTSIGLDFLNSGHIVLANIEPDPAIGGLAFTRRFEQTSGDFILASGTLQADLLEIQGGTFHAVDDPLTAGIETHVVQGPYRGGADSTLSLQGTDLGLWVPIFANGTDLTLGDAASYSGFLTEGTIHVADRTLTIENLSFANLGALTTLDGGTLAAADGIALGTGDNLVGAGLVNARVASTLGSTIQASGDLALGDLNAYDGYFSDGLLHSGQSAVTLNDRNAAVLGSLTTLGDSVGGGTLHAPNGLLLNPGKNLVGYGTVTADLTTNGDVVGEGPVPADALEFTGDVSGAGDFAGNIIFSGTYDPGNSAAEVLFENLTLSETATLHIELGGLDPGSEFDVLSASGHALLGGILQVSLIDGFIPELDDEFEFLSAESILDQFDEVILPDLGDGLFLALDVTSTTARLATVPEPSTLLLVAAGLALCAARRRQA